MAVQSNIASSPSRPSMDDHNFLTKSINIVNTNAPENILTVKKIILWIVQIFQPILNCFYRIYLKIFSSISFEISMTNIVSDYKFPQNHSFTEITFKKIDEVWKCITFLESYIPVSPDDSHSSTESELCVLINEEISCYYPSSLISDLKRSYFLVDKMININFSKLYVKDFDKDAENTSHTMKNIIEHLLKLSIPYQQIQRIVKYSLHQVLQNSVLVNLLENHIPNYGNYAFSLPPSSINFIMDTEHNVSVIFKATLNRTSSTFPYLCLSRPVTYIWNVKKDTVLLKFN
jgi:hypothetical protein